MTTIESSSTYDAAVTDAHEPGSLAQSDPARRRARERRRVLVRTVRQALLGLLLLAGVVATVLALRPGSVPIDRAYAVRGAVVVAIEESGMTRLQDRYAVSAPITGSLSRIGLEAGDVAREGDVLAEIAPTLSPLLDQRARAEAEARLGAALSSLGQAHAQAARSLAAREQAEQDLQRLRKLAQNGSIAAKQLEQAEFELRMREQELSSGQFASKVAAEEVRIARVWLGGDGARAAHDRHLDVIAPVSGRVLRVHQKSAGVVQAGTPLVEIGDPNALEVVVDVLTTDAVNIHPGTEVVIQDWGGDPLAGRVRRIEPSAFTRPSALGVDEQRVNVVIALTDPLAKRAALGDGYHVQARFVLWHGDGVIKVPEGAVFRHGAGWAVFTVRDSVAHLTPVSIGHRGESAVEISAGLHAGSAVAVHPGDRVADGVRVEAR